MRLDVPVYDVVVVAVLQGQQDLPEVVAAHGLGVDEAGRGALHYLEAEVGAGHELEHHVQHAFGAVWESKMRKENRFLLQRVCSSSL